MLANAFNLDKSLVKKFKIASWFFNILSSNPKSSKILKYWLYTAKLSPFKFEGVVSTSLIKYFDPKVMLNWLSKSK